MNINFSKTKICFFHLFHLFRLFFFLCFSSLSCFTLMGCAGMNTSNQCGVDKGIPCTRIDELNRKINRGKIVLDRESEQEEEESFSSHSFGSSFGSLQEREGQIDHTEREEPDGKEEGRGEGKEEGERMKRKELKVYVSPYSDQKGSLYSGHYIRRMMNDNYE